MFEGLDLGGQKSPIDVLNTLLDSVDIELKTDLSLDQIKVLVIVRWFSELSKEENKEKNPYTILDDVLLYYLKLMCSLDRKSRTEIIEGIKDLKKEFFEIEAARIESKK